MNDKQAPIYPNENSVEIGCLQPRPSDYLTFYNEKNEQVGTLDWSGGVFKFTGDAEKSAQIFAEHLTNIIKGKR
jgi:hypothetical protein